MLVINRPWNIQKFGTPRLQFRIKCMFSGKMEEGIISARSSTRSDVRLIGAIEEHFNVVALHDCKQRWSLRAEVNLLSIPIAGYSKTKHVPIIFGSPDEIRNTELRHCTFETDNWISH